MPERAGMVLQVGPVRQVLTRVARQPELLGAAVALLGLGAAAHWLYGRVTGDETGPVSLTEAYRQARDHEAGDGTAAIPDAGARQRARVAPGGLKEGTRTAQVGEQWVTALYVSDFPDYPPDGFLSELMTLTDVEFDLTARLDPLDQARATRRLRDIADDLRADATLDSTAHGSYLHKRAEEAVATYEAVEAGQRVFDLGLYVVVRAATREDLRDAARRVRRTLRDSPADCEPTTAVCRQRDALRAAAPLGGDPLERTSYALGGAVGALLASARAPTLLEPGGIEVGSHKDTGSPVVVDPFGRENGYATFTIGEPGSGKSFGAQQRFVRTLAQRDDCIGIVLEPMNDWVGVAEALDAERITVGGTCGLNPLELRPTPTHVQEAMGDDASPFNEKLDDVLSFLRNFFAMRGVTLGDRRATLEAALIEAYHRQGITEDITTHDNPSPTLRDVLDVLETMVAEPGEFVVRSDDEAAKIKADATWLLTQLAPFEEGGRYANLGRETEFDIHESDVVYLDLGQQEGRVEGGTGLTMQLLISLVYEVAKDRPEEVVLVIDESRYVLSNAASLSFLETVFRHHRHHDLSIRLVTQTVDEFFQQPEAEMILDQCAVKLFHRLEGMDDEWAAEFGLNPAQQRFIQEALPGAADRGYGQALLGVDGEWRGIEVRALPLEQQVIEYDPSAGDEVPEVVRADSGPGPDADSSGTDQGAATDD